MHRGQRARLGNQTDHAIKAEYKDAADFFAPQRKFFLLPGRHPYKRLAVQLKGDADMSRVAQIPGVGLLTATAAIATMGQASAFKSGREFCAWLGLVPTQTGTGGKVRLGSISKRGDTYLRTLLIHGARSVLAHAKQPGAWLEGIKGRRPANVVIVAQAAKTARTIWAVTARQQDYQRGHMSVRPQPA